MGQEMFPAPLILDEATVKQVYFLRINFNLYLRFRNCYPKYVYGYSFINKHNNREFELCATARQCAQLLAAWLSGRGGFG